MLAKLCGFPAASSASSKYYLRIPRPSSNGGVVFRLVLDNLAESIASLNRFLNSLKNTSMLIILGAAACSYLQNGFLVAHYF